MYTDREIYENRLKAVEYLKRPELKKAVGRLENFKTGGRCCLGHMCTALGIKRNVDYEGNVTFGNRSDDLVAPDELVNSLGLFNATGLTDDEAHLNVKQIQTPVYSLSTLNDDTRISTQSIGKYLESVIMGGADTPWRKINV